MYSAKNLYLSGKDTNNFNFANGFYANELPVNKLIKKVKGRKLRFILKG